MMMSLKRSGKLDDLAGLVVGGFTATKYDSEEAFNLSIEEIILDKVAEYGYPVCFHFPAGHVKTNNALKLGANYELNVGKDVVQLLEMRPLVSADLVTTSDYLSSKRKPATKTIIKNSITASPGQ
jgi:muramoyltetrapeptide carboxypeptidase